MQIMPTSSASMFDFVNTSSESATGSFLDAMDSALDAVNNNDYHSASAALNDGSAPLVESPYSRHTTDGVTYTLSEVCFTKQELQELRLSLIKEGAPVESLQQFDILADQPDGATLAQVMASLIGKKANTQLTDEDAHAITALLNQIDPTGQLAGDALGFMAQGNGSAALDLIQNALGLLDSGSGIDVDRDSLLALGRGLGLSTDSLRGLLSNMGGHSSLTLNAAQFDTLMNPAKNQFMEEAANATKLDAALEKTLKPIIAKARDRMEQEKAASELQNRRVEQSKILIDNTVQKNSREILEDTATGTGKDAQAELLAQEEAFGAMAKNTANANNSQGAVNDLKTAVQPQAQTQQQPAAFTGQNGNNSLFDGKNGDKSNGWQNLLGKTTVKTEQTPVASNSTSIVYSMLQGNLFQQASFMPEQTASYNPQLPQMVAQQVEQGMLTALRNGGTRLDLQLHPAELGAISITLIARNGELTAQIRSEKSETADMMTRQLDAIRTNLEQQGIKIDKIEVQLQDKQDNGGNSFDNLGQHNARQEENAFRQEAAQLRKLATMRNIMANAGDNSLAQSVHNNAHAARYADQSLHVVA